MPSSLRILAPVIIVVAAATNLRAQTVHTGALESSDPVMEDGADIELPDTGTPVELDRIYSSLRDLSEALGPNGVNKDGSLDTLLEAGAGALDG